MDATSAYRLYGNTASQIEAQAKQCAPKTDSSDNTSADFTAETSYSLTTQYGWTGDSNGQCSITSVKVGLHLNMVLPQWQATAAADSGLAGDWQTYINDLQAHENGHVAIDQQFANQILADLQSFPATDCNSIAAGLSAKISADTTALNAANDAYDTSTDHGATQGAILP